MSEFSAVAKSERSVYWQHEPTGDISACIAGQVEFFTDLRELGCYLSLTYPDFDFVPVEVTEDTWRGFYDQGVFFDDWS
ncbi:hypothetical protein [Aeromonas veronii]|uniref:hypothetical protein n=1 Tax=Aeromonas veronii TaxID=654 RepID=UPI001E53C297|nr:hypothetical protein [Aeromonas veronii]MCD6619577.1 hypothetical protein [Aeromonas veronii]